MQEFLVNVEYLNNIETVNIRMFHYYNIFKCIIQHSRCFSKYGVS